MFIGHTLLPCIRMYKRRGVVIVYSIQNDNIQEDACKFINTLDGKQFFLNDCKLKNPPCVS